MTKSEQVRWTLSNGKDAIVTMTLVDEDRTSTAYADGSNVKTSKHVTEITTHCEVEGMGRVADWISEQVSGEMRQLAADAAGLIGTIVVRQAQMDEIRAARARLEAAPEWQAHLERKAAKDAEQAEYEAHRERMRSVMGY